MFYLDSASNIWTFLAMHRLQSFAPAIVSRVLQTYVVNLICQKVQDFHADSDYVGKINKNKVSKKKISTFSFA